MPTQSPQPSSRRSWFLVPSVLLASSALSGCYTELEDKDQYIGKVAIDTAARSPNQAPPDPGAPGTMPPTPDPSTDPSTAPTTEPGFMFSEGCEDVVGTIFSDPQKCGGAPCHGGNGSKPPNINLGDPVGLRERVVNKPGLICSELSLVNEADPMQSAIIEKLRSAPSCGAPMPLGFSIPESDVGCIIEWVTAMANHDIE